MFVKCLFAGLKPPYLGVKPQALLSDAFMVVSTQPRAALQLALGIQPVPRLAANVSRTPWLAAKHTKNHWDLATSSYCESFFPFIFLSTSILSVDCHHILFGKTNGPVSVWIPSVLSAKILKSS